ncbi:hypothetical protein [Shimia abyssi]|uniref:hypothetical protein n=1 Tax=Shimia abyssi TaxID=1662395 RepID=UPI000D0D2F87
MGIGPFCWTALSGNLEEICKANARVGQLLPDNPHLHNWQGTMRRRFLFQGLTPQICGVV